MTERTHFFHWTRSQSINITKERGLLSVSAFRSIRFTQWIYRIIPNWLAFNWLNLSIYILFSCLVNFHSQEYINFCVISVNWLLILIRILSLSQRDLINSVIRVAKFTIYEQSLNFSSFYVFWNNLDVFAINQHKLIIAKNTCSVELKT